jgi:hypothetical protein
MVGSASSTTPRRVVLAAALSAVVLFLAGCGGQERSPDPTTNTVGAGQLGGAPTVSASAAPATATPPGHGGGGSGQPTYPKAANDYAVAFMQTYSSKNYDRVNQLAEQAVAQQVRDEVTTGGAPNSQWSIYSCSSVQPDGTVGCTLRNAHGDSIRVIMRASQLGFPTAVTRTDPLDRTAYPSTPEDYVRALLSAKGEDNKQRVIRLASSTVLSKLTCNLSSTYIGAEPIDAMYVKVVVQQTPTSPVSYEFKILKSPGGKANAVKEVLSADC